jgi:predicted nucleotidyltransferase
MTYFLKFFLSSDSNMSRNKYPDFTDNDFVKKLLRFPVFGVLVHWTLQGLLYMDWTERSFKLGLDAILTTIFAYLVGLKITFPYNWFLAFLIAHTLNFFLNAHFWTLLKHYGLISNSQEKFLEYSEKLCRRIASQKYITYAAVYGSWVRGEWSPASDLDVRVVHNGIFSGLLACVFLFSERTRALFNHFPLDIYVLDNFIRLADMRSDEKPEVIVDRRTSLP